MLFVVNVVVLVVILEMGQIVFVVWLQSFDFVFKFFLLEFCLKVNVFYLFCWFVDDVVDSGLFSECWVCLCDIFVQLVVGCSYVVEIQEFFVFVEQCLIDLVVV